jgi:hypothetical protein
VGVADHAREERAVELRHVHVEQNDLRAELPDRAQRPEWAAVEMRRKAGRGERMHELGPELDVVIDDEDARHPQPRPGTKG